MALLRTRRAFDGPKSQAVEAVRAQLAVNPEFMHEPVLASLPAFHGFLLCLPAVQVWTSKTSDIVRCMLRRSDDEPPAPPAFTDGCVPPTNHIDSDILQVNPPDPPILSGPSRPYASSPVE